MAPGPTGSPSPPDTTGPQGLLIGGSWVRTDRTFDVTNAFDGERVATISAATESGRQRFGTARSPVGRAILHVCFSCDRSSHTGVAI